MRPLRPATIHVAFFLSGGAAVIYQLVWQRALVTVFGADVEMVTIVVTAFMAGLGLGSLAGGVIARRASMRLPLAFAVIEFGVAAWGLASLFIIRQLGTMTVGASELTAALAVFAALLVPTVLMGATLPILVQHEVRQKTTVGRAVGGLYASNTFGSAAGALAAILVILGAFGQQGSVRMAALLNVSVAFIVLWRSRATPGPASTE